ncbi:MAG: Gfo/Idh/MocA family oxidoreductase [Acidobacteria bacterium]|nr:Gfo/Idh/MocA family oxidoreductase [Acidobacteriota bacterium]
MKNEPATLDRRSFVAGAGALLAFKPEPVRMALVGCGGRGTGVAESFTLETSARYVALADLFQEQTERAQQTLGAAAAKRGKPGVESSALFHGPQCLQRLLAARDIDVIHIATPPYFHPEHFEACAAAGKHVYLEKPVAVDVPGTRRVLRAGERLKGKASVAVGFQLRHATPYVQLVERIRRGDIGAIVCGLTHYYAGAIPRPDWPDATPAERRLRNWVHDRVLSGDILVEQNIHLVDVTNWVLEAHPLSAQGTGGRAGRNDRGDAWSHFNVNYTYPNNVHITLTSTQFIEGAWDVAMRYFGTTGNAEMRYDAPVRITGAKKWDFPGLGAPGQVTDTAAAVTGAFKGALDDADQKKQRHFIDSIVSGKFLNEASQGVESALSAMLGRQAAYTGRPWTWDELLRLGEVWDAKLDVARL